MPGVVLDRFTRLKPDDFVSVYDLVRDAQVVFFQFNSIVEVKPSDRDVIVQVVAQDRLDLLAHRYYGSSLLWWVIAYRNGIELPTAELYPGRQIVIPDPAAVRDALSL